jgi:hypothetical protein
LRPNFPEMANQFFYIPESLGNDPGFYLDNLKMAVGKLYQLIDG